MAPRRVGRRWTAGRRAQVRRCGERRSGGGARPSCRPAPDKTSTALDVRELGSGQSVLATAPAVVPGKVCSAGFSGDGQRIATVSLTGKRYEARSFEFAAGSLRAVRAPVPITMNAYVNGDTAYLRIAGISDDGQRLLLSRFCRFGTKGTPYFGGCAVRRLGGENRRWPLLPRWPASSCNEPGWPPHAGRLWRRQDRHRRLRRIWRCHAYPGAAAPGHRL